MKNFSGYSVVISPPQNADVQKQTNSCSLASSNHLEKPLNEDLNLVTFKAAPCQNNTLHNQKQCRFYHSGNDRRRPFQPYFSELCQVAQQYLKDQKIDYQCPNGDHCQKCHNKVEQMYSLQKYKTKFCSHYPKNINQCEYQIYCPFAHRQDQIRTELIHHYVQDADFFIFHYKTIWCPFNYIKHDRSRCVYAHNWQDFRRKPHVYQYQPLPCPNWNPNNFIMNYEEECVNQSFCNKCHGWKEIQYHPLNYKMRQCSGSVKCSKGKFCPYFHQKKEVRKFTQQIRSGFFVNYPRNRRTKDETNTLQDIKFCFGKQSTKVSHEDSISQSSYDDNCQQQDDVDVDVDEQIQAMVNKLVDQ